MTKIHIVCRWTAKTNKRLQVQLLCYILYNSLGQVFFTPFCILSPTSLISYWHKTWGGIGRSERRVTQVKPPIYDTRLMSVAELMNEPSLCTAIFSQLYWQFWQSKLCPFHAFTDVLLYLVSLSSLHGIGLSIMCFFCTPEARYVTDVLQLTILEV